MLHLLLLINMISIDSKLSYYHDFTTNIKIVDVFLRPHKKEKLFYV